MAYLLLGSWDFFSEDPGHCGPACVCVSKFVAIVAVSNPESHSHFSLVNVIAMTFNVAVTVKVKGFASSCCHIKCSINWPRRATLGAIEGEIPTTAAAITVVNPEITIKVNMEGSFREILHELTALQKKVIVY